MGHCAVLSTRALAAWSLLLSGILGVTGLPAAADRGAIGSDPAYQLALSALMDASGATEVDVAITPRTPAFSIPGGAKQVLLKSYLSGGSGVFWARTFHRVPLDAQGVARFQFTDLLRGQPLSVQVVMQTAETVNAQVYRADARVLDRPDLEIKSLSAPQRVFVNQPVNIQATIDERIGDSGATCDVVLMDSAGNLLDEARGVAVAPGGTVGVVLTTRFAAPGTYTLTVQIQDSNPAEFDAANDQNDTATITIQVSQVVPTAYEMTYQDSSSWFQFLSEVTTFDRTTLKFSSTTTEQALGESFLYSSTFNTALLSQAGFSVNIASDGQNVISANLAAVAPTFSTTIDLGGGDTLSYSIYSFPLDSAGTNWIQLYTQSGTGALSGELSNFTMSHYAEDLVFFSSTFNSTWNPPTSTVTSTFQAGTFWHARSTIHTDIEVIASDGTQYGGQADLLVSGPTTSDFGPVTWSFGDPASDSWYSGSEESHSQQWSGSGSGMTQ